MTDGDWYEFPFYLRLNMPDGNAEFEFVIIAKAADHVRAIGAMLAYLYRSRSRSSRPSRRQVSGPSSPEGRDLT